MTDGFRGVEARMDQLEQHLADLEGKFDSSCGAAIPRKKAKKAYKEESEIWDADFNGKLVKIKDLPLDVVSAMVDEKRNYMRSNDLIQFQDADYVDRVMPEHYIKYLSTPVTFGRMVADLLVSKEQQQFFKMVFKSQRASDRRSMPAKYIKRMRAILEYAGASVIQEEERDEYMVCLYTGLNDRSLNMKKSGRSRNVTMYIIEGLKIYWEDETELMELMQEEDGTA
uniref:Uncharacterized protein n=1 Tax=Strongyloides venezuelensis TaxID=75913 RepID=A0A0K0FP90_STRVS